MNDGALPGALVISLDFELHWGMRDHVAAGDPATAELLHSRAVVTELVDLFVERGIGATWATVGFLFASSRAELDAFRPTVTPRYVRTELDAYREPVGDDEATDPLHLAGSLVRRVASAPGQEVGSHTFSHYYCLEEGQDETAFRADLAAARAIGDHLGMHMSSLVLPRNQWNPRYADAVRQNGFRCYRGTQPSWAHEARSGDANGLLPRAARLADTYVGLRPPPTTTWDQLDAGGGLCNVPASAFLRPYSPERAAVEPLRRARLAQGLRQAAQRGRIFHLWWHPHNFSRHRVQSFDLLRHTLDDFARLSASEGMRSMTMAEVADIALGSSRSRHD